jgi:YD repeat-containing protein
MIRNSLLLKTIAVFFILEILITTVSPMISMALTAGPTAPEATSFEPVDTTDMVNLATGDLAYNIPLLEVPGPSGGYPLSLSYHDGIQPNEEASWVGLGWTLNPGAIVRNVNGFADDQKDVETFSRFYWKGGSTETYSVGVSVGLAGTPASVNAGLSIANDTYRGIGVGCSVGVGYAIGGEGSPVGVGVSVGVGPYGGSYASAGLSLSAPIEVTKNTAVGLSIDVGVSTNFESVSGYAGMGVSVSHTNPKRVDKPNTRRMSLMDANISAGSSGTSTSLSITGVSNISNAANSARTRSTSSGFTIPIPVFYGVSITLGYNYQRYWIDEMDRFKINGSLYYPDKSQVALTKAFFDKNAFDTYSLLDPTLEGGVIDNPDADKVLGGSFPSVDNYSVHAQGLFGQMEPHYFKQHLYKRNNYNIKSDGGKKYQTFQYDMSQLESNNYRRAEFRFVNDFSNRFEYTPATIEHVPNINDPDIVPLSYNFNTNANQKIGEAGSASYTTNQIQGSRHVTWLTNQEILSQNVRATAAGFIETVSSGFTRNTPEDGTDDEQIGGFVIMNESGVKYHFALPAYSYDEYMYSENNTETLTFNEFDRPTKYAYTWYLTAITGPDYVDRGPSGPGDGKLNEHDWGYWVEFEYGKWTDHYGWRTPAQGMTPDLDDKFRNFSEGIKQVYYLDAIRTKTHSALFFKEVRHDAKGTVSYMRDLVQVWDDLTGEDKERGRRKKFIPETKDGGFTPTPVQCKCEKIFLHFPGGDEYKDRGYLNYTPLPVSSLKLNSIVLISNDKLANATLAKSAGAEQAQSISGTWVVQNNGLPARFEQCDFSPMEINYHLYQNVYDKYDLTNSSGITQGALRTIDFSTDYSLSPGTANSFDYTLVQAANPPTNEASYPKYGKLTLNALQFKGKSESCETGDCILPPMRFKYDLDAPVKGGRLEIAGNNYTLTASQDSDLAVGDIIVFGNGPVKYFALIRSTTNNVHKLEIISDQKPVASEMITFKETKNPPYHKDRYDSWGLYKSDYDPTITEQWLLRAVTELSSKSTDVWSLRKVRTATGADILFDYESDKYRRPVLNVSTGISVKNVQQKLGGISWITLSTVYENLNEIIHPGQELRYQFMFGDIWTFETSNCPLNTAEHGFQRNLGTGTIQVQNLFKDAEGNWVISTNTSLQHFYRVLPDESGDLGWPCEWDRDFKNPVFVAGHVNLTSDIVNYGGGLRVKSISVASNNNYSSTRYNYDGIIDGVHGTSGFTSYSPGGLSQIEYHFPEEHPLAKYFENTTARNDLEKEYKKEFYKGFENILANSRIVPPPGIVYKNVTVSESNTLNGETSASGNYSTYEFQVFDAGMVGVLFSNDQSETFATKNYGDYANYDKKETRNVTVKDYTSRTGVLKKITLYKDGQKLSETINHYLHDEARPDLITQNDPAIEDKLEANVDLYEPALDEKINNQGVIEQTFTDARFARPESGKFILQGVISKQERYPSVQLGQTSINYKTGIQTESHTLAFDYYSGQVTKTLQQDGYGNSFVESSTPAYRKYAQMGQKASGGTNMLLQTAESYTYKVDPQNSGTILGLVGASVQTWSESIPSLLPGVGIFTQPGIWRKHAKFDYIGDNTQPITGDGLIPITENELPVFSGWTNGQATLDWQKTSEINFIDAHSHILQVRNLSDIYSATKLSSDYTSVLATVSNGGYDDFAFSGAEDKLIMNTFGGNVSAGQGFVNPTGLTSHTGKCALQLDAGQIGFTYETTKSSLKNQGKYHASVWVMDYPGGAMPQVSLIAETNNGTQLGSASPVADYKAGNWYLIRLDFDLHSESEQVKVYVKNNSSGPGLVYADDFRVHPLDAGMTSYVYNEWGELTHILDGNNLFTRFEYDQAGRLVRTFRESFSHPVVKVSETAYQYKLQND